MWMQFSIASWEGMFVLTAKQIETTFNEPTCKVELTTYKTVYLHSLISNGCLIPPFPILSMAVVFFP